MELFFCKIRILTLGTYVRTSVSVFYCFIGAVAMIEYVGIHGPVHQPIMP